MTNQEYIRNLTPSAAGWVQDQIADDLDRRDAEIERLKSENVALRSEIEQLRKGKERLHTENLMVIRQRERLKEDAERYRFLRDEDNWGCDNDETTESRWGDLGECHGGDFDAFVDKARAALAATEETTHG